MGYNELAFVILSAVALAVTAAVAGRGGRAWIAPKLLVLGMALRVVGSMARYEVLFQYYGGLGDAVRYYQQGLELARMVWSFQLSPFSLDYWVASGQWWGTLFLVRISGLAVTALGPTLRGEFLAFAAVSFVGLYYIAKALRNSQPDPRSHHRFAAWLWLWPSIWFWPSSVGKEAILTLAVGLATYGYVGRGRGLAWVHLVAGLALAFCIRPHVAAVLAVAALAAHWLGSWDRVTIRRLAEVVLVLILAFVALAGMREQLGLADADLEGVKEFVQYRSQQTLSGGSQIATVPLGPHGIPIAFVNVWMRPFPWDVHNATAAISALEMLVFWGFVIYRRRAVWLALKSWRRHRLLLFALPLLVIYTLMIGLAFSNLGIIARQRVLVFPFMIAFLTAAPDPQRMLSRRPQSTRQPDRRAA